MQTRPKLGKISEFCSYLLIETSNKEYADKFPFIVKASNNKSYLTSISCLIWILKNTVIVFTSGYIIQDSILERKIDDNFSTKRFELQNSHISETLNYWLYFPFDTKQEDSSKNYIKMKIHSLFFSKEIANLMKQSQDYNNDIKAISNSVGTILALSCSKVKDLNDILSYFNHRQRLQFGKSEPVTGNLVYAISSPFGLVSPSLFRNTTRKAVVSKIIAPGLGLIDIPIRYGEQGTSIFNENMEVVGLIVGTIRPPNTKEAQGIALCAFFHSFDHILNDLMATSYEVLPELLRYKQHYRDQVQLISNLVIQLKAGAKYTAGVIIHKEGYVLAKKRVLQIKEKETEQIFGYSHLFPHPIRLEVIAAATGDLDFALLKVPDEITIGISPELKSLFEEFRSRSKIYKGEDVYGIGYSIFGEDKRAVVVSGTLVKRYKAERREILLQTDVPVNARADGGIIVDVKGCFLGLITCSVFEKSNQSISHINYSYAKPLFDDIIFTIKSEAHQISKQQLNEKLRQLEVWNYKHGLLKKLNELQQIGTKASPPIRPKL